jgi:hypothetical protein
VSSGYQTLEFHYTPNAQQVNTFQGAVVMLDRLARTSIGLAIRFMIRTGNKWKTDGLSLS